MADPAPTPAPAPAPEPPPPAEPPAGIPAPPEPAPPTDPASSAPPAEPQPADPPAEPDGLGDAGKKALTEERTARKEAEKALKTAQAELAQVREAQMSEHERAVAEARREGETTTTETFQRRLFAAEAKVAAANKLADPTLLSDPDVALGLLGLKELPVDSAGDIDSEAISKAIDTLIEGRPFLKVSTEPAHATWPSNGTEAGPRGDAKSQLTQADLKQMSPEEIVTARAEGRLTKLLGS